MVIDNPTDPAETGIQPANQAPVFLSMDSNIFEIEKSWFSFLFYYHLSMSGCKRTCCLGNYDPISTNTACWTPHETAKKRSRVQGIWHFSHFLLSFFFI